MQHDSEQACAAMQAHLNAAILRHRAAVEPTLQDA
jgi:GntR family transcriptional repressor for pyruvate dehydrogenase complex